MQMMFPEFFSLSATAAITQISLGKEQGSNFS